MEFMTNYVEWKESGLSRHKHGVYEIIYYMTGSGTFYFDGGQIDVNEGDIMIVPEGVNHVNLTSSKMTGYYVNGDFAKVIANTVPVLLHDTTDREGRTLMELIYENRYSDKQYLSALCGAYVRFLLKNMKSEDSLGRAVTDVVNKITNEFHNDSLNLVEILTESGYAEDYIRARFKKIMGKTPNEFLSEVRIRHAMHLITIYKNNLSLGEVGYRCGYSDYVHFSHKFKKITGVSPRDFQKNC